MAIIPPVTYTSQLPKYRLQRPTSGLRSPRRTTPPCGTFIHSQSSGLNLTAPSKAKANDNYVYFIDTVPVNKSDALAYIDGSAAKPHRYARVIVVEGSKKIPVAQEYMVGPLPVSDRTTIDTLDYLYNGGAGASIPWNTRNIDAVWVEALVPLLASIMPNITDITQALLGGVYLGYEDNSTTLSSIPTTPISFNGNRTIANIAFRLPGPAQYLQPLDFYVLLDVTGTDAAHYHLRGIVTNDRYFETVATLREAWGQKELNEDFFHAADAS